MAYDEKCYELAVEFLKDYSSLDCEETRRNMAEDIQAVLESYVPQVSL